MASLKSGSLSKLLEDMNLDKNGSEDYKKPLLLQIRSIIPVLEKDDLWPNRGFYLKVSDLTHATYVSLPPEHDEMILNNKLQLGQFLYVQKFEAALPVPVLRGVMPVSGRRSCEGTPEDILPVNNLARILEAPDIEMVKDKGVISEKRNENDGLPESDVFLGNSSDPFISARSLPSDHILRALNGETKVIEAQKSELSSVENDTDSDSQSNVSSSTQIPKRRSWNTAELMDVKAIFDSSMANQEMKPKSRSRSVCASPVRSGREDSSDDNSAFARRRRASVSNIKAATKSSSKGVLPGSKTRCEACPKVSGSERMVEESKIKWDSLPSSLMKLGEDMVRQRDISTLAAAEALQEACAAEKLIRCLSIYSDIKSVREDEDPQPVIDKFFQLQDSLSQTRLLFQSLTNISPLKTPDSDISSTSSVKEVLNLAVERKKKATSCIKSAISSDLSPCSCSHKHSKISNNIAKKERKSSNLANSNNSTPKIFCMVRKERTNCEIKGAQSSDWVKGNSFTEAADLANLLQEDSQKSFLGYVEKFLDEVESRTKVINSDMKIASLMCQIKRVNDWLDVVSKEDFEDSEIEACGRVRNKIYSVLLKHVERTAMALESMNKAGQRF